MRRIIVTLHANHRFSVNYNAISLTYAGSLETALPLQSTDFESITWPRQRDYAAKATTFFAQVEEPLKIADIQEELTRENYKQKFHKLLYLEERAHIEFLGKK